MGVWKRKEAAKRDEAAELLERLEWFNRPELAQRPRPVREPAAAPAVERASAVEEAPPAVHRTDWGLPAPPWEARAAAEATETLTEERAPEPEAAVRWLVAPPRPVAQLKPAPAVSEPSPAPAPKTASVAAVGEPEPPKTMRVYRRRLRPALLGLLALSISGAFIFAASALNSSDSSDATQVESAAPTSAGTPTKRAQTPPAKRTTTPPKGAARPAPKPAVKAKPKTGVAPKPAVKATPKPTVKVTPKPAAKPKPKPAARPKPKPAQRPTPTPATSTTLPPFAWSPVAGAGSYEFQLFRGSKLVYSARTQTPGITVPATWTRSGRFYQVEPGHYRWYVWAIVGGQKSTSAVVQATLDVPK